MRYDIRVTNADGSVGRFELEQDEELKVGSPLRQWSMVYEVRLVLSYGLDESDQFDAVVEADWRLGPVQAGYRDS